ncbi:hypothetical protein M404DRAFT_833915 [Pisolithus tinctorius Marx 270]|uniref:Uncharacterized protein n=1 Tax=Pisolithus tinctorius Marx 270 TaxID=870435 RepID=A0A0C3PRB6_PISTI|nr:hypothetical protein M404DRAFT_833915 [Pisolithus tinctorius Marx 270]
MASYKHHVLPGTWNGNDEKTTPRTQPSKSVTKCSCLGVTSQVCAILSVQFPTTTVVCHRFEQLLCDIGGYVIHREAVRASCTGMLNEYSSLCGLRLPATLNSSAYCYPTLAWI